MPNNIFMSVATQRYSCRSFSDRKVERELLEELLQAAQMAPSACNRQPWMFYVVNTPEKVAELKACYAREWVENVGTFIVAVGNVQTARTIPISTLPLQLSIFALQQQRQASALVGCVISMYPNARSCLVWVLEKSL